MTTFKNIFGEVVTEITEKSSSVNAENFVRYWNNKAKNIYTKIVEIDFNNGMIIFLNK